MRRDLCYFFPTDVVNLYNAYLLAAKNPPFERSCSEEPYHTFTFGLNFSMKYNMNGGSCTLRFIRCQGGSAVNLRFSIAQLAGARYEKYASNLTNKASEFLRLSGQRVEIPVEEFLKVENQVSAGSQVITSVYKTEKQQPCCSNCGMPYAPGSAFCSNCGEHLKQTNAFCSGCGEKTSPGAVFCSKCGKKL